LRFLALSLCFLLGACSTDVENLAATNVDPPDPAKVLGALKNVATAAKLQDPVEMSAPIKAELFFADLRRFLGAQAARACPFLTSDSAGTPSPLMQSPDHFERQRAPSSVGIFILTSPCFNVIPANSVSGSMN
jgi:hypothetical protein